jgi:succinyl-diaminopimelate desuccinylase
VTLDLTRDPAGLALDLVAIASPSGQERPLADALAAALAKAAHLEVLREGDTVVARTHLGRPERVIVAGHIDTVPPSADLVPALSGGRLWGRGAVDMKAGLAVMSHLAATLKNPSRDVTWVFYDHEEVARDLNGLRRVIAVRPDWIAGTFAVLGEPTATRVEGGCNGSLRAEVVLRGKAAHSARAWLGLNAIHAAAPVLTRLAAYTPGSFEVDGLTYPESMNAVLIEGGSATNVIPDLCKVTVNYRFAPDKSVDDAVAHLTAVLAPFEMAVVDRAPAARPGLDAAPARQFAGIVARHGGGEPVGKVGWTDVAQFAELGIPALNCGPGSPALAHSDNEHCPVDQIDRYAAILKEWLS